jgi:hypothetical protein
MVLQRLVDLAMESMTGILISSTLDSKSIPRASPVEVAVLESRLQLYCAPCYITFEWLVGLGCDHTNLLELNGNEQTDTRSGKVFGHNRSGS